MLVCNNEFAQWTTVVPNAESVSFRFSTDEVQPHERLTVLRDVLARVDAGFDITPLGDAPFRATLEHHGCSSLSLFFGETSAASVSRTPELVADRNDDFLLLIVNGARYQFISDGIVEEMADGDAVLLSNARVATVRYLGACRVTAVRLPSSGLRASTRGFKELAIQRLAPSTKALRLLAKYIDMIREVGPANDPVFAHRLAGHLIDLVALALEPHREARIAESAPAARDARFAVIRADVLANLSQVGLSAKTVAQRHRITDRYVHLLFEQTGQTFSRFVQEERLKRAFALLTDPERAAMRISEIAFEAGFTDLSTFNRTFRRRFGDRPRGIRQASKASGRESKSQQADQQETKKQAPPLRHSPSQRRS